MNNPKLINSIIPIAVFNSISVCFEFDSRAKTESNQTEIGMKRQWNSEGELRKLQLKED